ncbi:uncharacterized protein LOC143283004 [Babylonia areolata]|uniref:uncharacterized protein LOC143283004 n=1 Tax=Babylonia areolata TaxID=304850 RepID=UPI003FD58D47
MAAVDEGEGGGAMELLEVARDEGEGGGGGGGGQQSVVNAEVLNLTLHQCARDGDEYNMKLLLRHLGTATVKEKINHGDEYHLTPLHYAARYHFLGVVELLVENGADVNKRDEDDITPLHHAAGGQEKKGERDTSRDSAAIEAQKSVINFLILNGANINCRDIYGQTPLHFAAMRGNEVACRDLLSISDVDIEAKDETGITPLHMAVIHNQQEIASMLLSRELVQRRADPRSKDNKQLTPLHYACREGNVKLVKTLFQGRDLEIISKMVLDHDTEGSTCLHLAVESGHCEVARMVLEQRAEVNRPRKYNMFPLHLTAMSGDISTARLLVDYSARIDMVNDDQATALHKAASLNHTEVVELLLGRKANIERRDKDNYTPLLLAARNGHVETVGSLLKNKADGTAVDKNDRTVVYLAAAKNRLEVLKKLLSDTQLKTLINTRDRYGNSPLHIAVRRGHLDIVKELLKRGAAINSKNEEKQTPLHLAAKLGRTNIVREIVGREKPAKGLHDEDNDANTPLHLAAQCGHSQVVQVLLELGANVLARNHSQWTPLDLAASQGRTKSCSLLLNSHAPVEATDTNKKTTPLHLAARSGHLRVVELLLDWDADVAQEDTEGYNCLDLAIENNHANVALSIINSDVWQQALRNSTEDPATGRIDTPMRKLIKKMPEVAVRVFDRCLSYGQEKNPERPGFEITFNYEFLDDTYMQWIHESYRKQMRGDDTTSISDTSSMESNFDDNDRLRPTAKPYSSNFHILKKNHPLSIMVSSQREILLDHPLVTSLLNHKWSTFGRFYYYLSFFIYCTFLVFLTEKIVKTYPPESYQDWERAYIIDHNMCSEIKSHTPFSKVGTYFIIGIVVFNLLKELLQIYQATLAYLKLGLVNLIEWTIYVTALLLVISFNECMRDTGYKYDWQWSVGAVSVFLAWINLVLFIQRFPQLGIYVVMFTEVLYTFIKFFVVVFIFIVAFALAFFMVLQKQTPFANVPHALIKTSVMIFGEFEFDTIFDEPSTNDVPHPEVSYILLVCFLILMSILLMNVLIGLAVYDIKAVQKKAALKRLAMQVELVLNIEEVMPAFIRRKTFAKQKTIKTNQDPKNKDNKGTVQPNNQDPQNKDNKDSVQPTNQDSKSKENKDKVEPSNQDSQNKDNNKDTAQTNKQDPQSEDKDKGTTCFICIKRVFTPITRLFAFIAGFFSSQPSLITKSLQRRDHDTSHQGGRQRAEESTELKELKSMLRAVINKLDIKLQEEEEEDEVDHTRHRRLKRRSIHPSLSQQSC